MKETSTISRVRINIGQCMKGTRSLGEDKLVNDRAKAKKLIPAAMFWKRQIIIDHVKTTEIHVPIGSKIIAYIANSIWNNILNTKP